MNTRLIKRRDLRACAAILAADKLAGFHDVDSALAVLVECFETENPLGMLAETGAAVGFVLGNIVHRRFGSVFYLVELNTHVSNRLRGVGTTVYKALEAELRARSVGSIYVPEDRLEHSLGFFVKRNFRRVDPADYYTKLIAM